MVVLGYIFGILVCLGLSSWVVSKGIIILIIFLFVLGVLGVIVVMCVGLVFFVI